MTNCTKGKVRKPLLGKGWVCVIKKDDSIEFWHVFLAVASSPGTAIVSI